MKHRLGFAAASLVLFAATSTCLWAADRNEPPLPPANPPPGPPKALADKLELEEITTDTKEPTAIVAAPGEPVGRLFVLEKAGPIRILRGKTFDKEPFFDLTGKVALEPRENGEQGLLGLAFHPRFKENRRFYLHYNASDGSTRIVEMKVDAKNPNRADPKSARELFTTDQPYANHNAGDIAFGPDGKLYVLLGDGGKGDDPHGYAQNPKSLLGKAIVIDVDAKEVKPQVVAKGFRNPWRYTFDPKTGDLYIADVGQRQWEYVHVVPKGKFKGQNFGWNIVEGNHCFLAKTCKTKGLTRPVVEFSHREGCSITGGHVYRGKAIPELDGAYFYSDYCTAILRSFRVKNGKAVDQWDWKAALDPEFQLAKIASFGVDQDGELYVVSHDGPIYKLVRR